MNKIWSQNCPVREGPYMIPKWTTERSQSDQIGHQSNGLIGSQNGSIWSQNSRRPQIVSQNHLHLWFVFFGREKITRMITWSAYFTRSWLYQPMGTLRRRKICRRQMCKYWSNTVCHLCKHYHFQEVHHQAYYYHRYSKPSLYILIALQIFDHHHQGIFITMIFYDQ